MGWLLAGFAIAKANFSVGALVVPFGFHVCGF
jgi:hypothetical protein